MRGREFSKKIQVFETVAVATPGGGNESVEVLIASCWAKIESMEGSGPYKDLGLDFTRNILKITVRDRNDIFWNSTTMFFSYRGAKYSITKYPTNLNFTDAFIRFIATEIKPAAVKGNNIPALRYQARVENDGGEMSSASCSEKYVDSIL